MFRVSPEQSNKRPLKLFIRTDKNANIENLRLGNYRVAPAYHLSLQNSELESQEYTSSGFLSTFDFAKGYGLQSVLDYARLSNSSYIHFIFLPSGISEIVKLNGGTRGFDEDKKPKRVEGSVWELPFYQKNIPQLFYTDEVDVELGQNCWRTDHEVLLGGNWSSFAQVISIENHKTLDLQKILKGKSEQEVLEWLIENGYTSYRPGIEGQHQLTLPEQIEESAINAQLINWWNSQLPEDQHDLNCVYCIINNKKIEVPRLDDFDFLKGVQAISRSKESTPKIERYFRQFLLAVEFLYNLGKLEKNYTAQMDNFRTLGFWKIFSTRDRNSLSTEEIQELMNGLDLYVDFLKEESRLAKLAKKIEAEMKNPIHRNLLFPNLGEMAFIFNAYGVQIFNSLRDFVAQSPKSIDAMKKFSSVEIALKLKAYRDMNNYVKESNVAANYFAPLEQSKLLTKEFMLWLRSFCDEYAIRLLQLRMDSKTTPANWDLMQCLKQLETQILHPLLELVRGCLEGVLTEQEVVVAYLKIMGSIVELNQNLIVLKQQEIHTAVSSDLFFQPIQPNQKRSLNQNDDNYSEGNPKRVCI
ncbi:hypothetical protein [Legionella waltersii]|uniref:Uncharacterized protein n=1 Tax=Legionella waltersii TaxID=66969 RepID=A0A0W1A1V3_9GAMM|nr:hypothetical protein [Legionella waltersii]KTD75300.1 hypothetical protein Lwal_3341 [Legionella waltersii]SNV07013.1 Uncharacterised protein [Legionella waltersii]